MKAYAVLLAIQTVLFAVYVLPFVARLYHAAHSIPTVTP